ncbi:MAG TPA: TolC family protein [Candidatus Tenderia sp.]|nr:TolC family protein [Candidatus Tenderia sp.]
MALPRYRPFTLFAPLLLSVMAFVPALVQAQAALTLEQAVAEALAANPGLSAIEARAQALAEIPDQAEALPDPVLSVNIANLPLDSFSFTQEGMTQFQVGITQALPYPGKLALRAQAASQQARAATFDLHERRLQLVRDVKTVWWNIFYLDRALEVVERNQVLLAQFVNVAETRYTVGRGLQQDILLAQLELSKLGDSRIRILNMRDNQVTRLNVLMDHQATDAIVLPAAVDERLQTLLDAQQLLQQAETARPRLAAQGERMGAARSRIDLAKKEYAPDFKVGAVYGLRGGNNPDGSSRADLGSIRFSMNLPLYTGSKQDRAVDQRKAEWLTQKYQLQDQRNEVASQVQQAMIDYRRAGEQVALFKQEIIPQARQTVDAMLAGYQVGKVDFLNLVRSQTTLYNYETQYWNALSSANQALARLIAAVGEENVYE